MEFKSKALLSAGHEMGIEKEDPAMLQADVLLDESYRGQPLRAAVAASAPVEDSAESPAAAVENAINALGAINTPEAVKVESSDAKGIDVKAPESAAVAFPVDAPVVDAPATASASDAVVATGSAATPAELEMLLAAEAAKKEEDKPEEEKPEAELSDIERLVGMMSGTIKVVHEAAASAIAPAVAKDAAASVSPTAIDPEIDDLVGLMKGVPTKKVVNQSSLGATVGSGKSPVVPVVAAPMSVTESGGLDKRIAQGVLDKQSLRAERSQMESGAARAPQAQGAGPAQGGQQMVAGGASTNLGNVIGQVAAEAVAMPFVALTAAGRHLRNKFANAKAMQAVPAASGNPSESFGAKFAMPMSVANTLEAITDWKVGRIEASSKTAQLASQALINTEEFVVWEDKMRNMADSLGLPPRSVVEALGTDERFAGLKQEMDAVWTANADKVEAYRAACNDFERNVLNVVKEYPNSEKETQERVTSAMSGVAQKSESMPGFGTKIGEYDQRTMMERMEELARMIAKFFASLFAKITGKPSSELSL